MCCIWGINSKLNKKISCVKNTLKTFYNGGRHVRSRLVYLLAVQDASGDWQDPAGRRDQCKFNGGPVQVSGVTEA